MPIDGRQPTAETHCQIENLLHGGGGFGTRPRYLIVCLWRRLLASRHFFDYPRVGCPRDGLLPVPLTRCIQLHTPSPCWVCRLQH